MTSFQLDKLNFEEKFLQLCIFKMSISPYWFYIDEFYISESEGFAINVMNAQLDLTFLHIFLNFPFFLSFSGRWHYKNFVW